MSDDLNPISHFENPPNPFEGGYQDWQRSGALGPANYALAEYGGETGAMLLDPMDLFGERAASTQAEIDRITRESTQAGINALREQYERASALQQPFLEYGQEALGRFGQYEQGPYFQQQLEEGRNALMGSAAAAGLGQSSYSANRLADFVNQLTQEDVQRQYMQNIDAIRAAQGAAGSIGAASQQLGQGAGALYGQQGSLANLAAQNYGQQRAQAYQGAGQVLSGLGAYMGSR